MVKCFCIEIERFLSVSDPDILSQFFVSAQGAFSARVLFVVMVVAQNSSEDLAADRVSRV